MSDNTTDEDTEDAGQLQIQLTDIGADPTDSIALDDSWIQWLLEQPVPSNVEGIDESISDAEEFPNV
jgi:hypothetical protein